jgi:starvation-inducible DNA-binding protein
MKPNIGITDANLKKTSDILNVLLADEFTLYAKIRNYHWNVTNTDFVELHKYFETQYEEIDEVMDAVAERVRVLGHNAIGTLEAFMKNTNLKESNKPLDAQGMIKSLLNDHETIIRSIRDNIDTVIDKYKDAGTGDFITGVMEKHEKMAWMLRSYLR